MKSQVTQPTIKDVDPGLYEATFQGREGPKMGEFGEFNVWNFTVESDDGLLDYSGICSNTFVATAKCKAYRWAQAIDPTLNEETVEWDDEDHIGAEVTIALEWQEPDTPGFLKIKEVYPKAK